MHYKAKIYQPAKTAMQSGKAKTKQWVLEYTPMAPMTPDPLMGWNTMSDTTRQLQVKFDSQEAAEAYAKQKNLDYEVLPPKHRAVKPKAYAANFAFERQLPYDKRA